MNEKIKVTLHNGKIKVEAIGFTGTTCEDATRFVEAALGTPSNREHKPEFYAVEELPQHLTN